MAHTNQCQSCGTSFVGNINRRFCTDACRKYHKRHDGVSQSGLATTPADTAAMSGQRRTSARSGLVNYAGKTLIDLVGKMAEQQLLPDLPAPKSLTSSPVLPNGPLLTAVPVPASAAGAPRVTGHYRPQLAPVLQAFLGELTYPFQALIWGLPGSGKSTFSMRLANALAAQFKVLYLSGEEDLNSPTLQQKQARTITRHAHFLFVNRLPNSAGEWRQLLYPSSAGLTPSAAAARIAPAAGSLPAYRTIVYDSITMMGLQPFHVKATAKDCQLPAYSQQLGHLFISHAHKDGKEYRGAGSWGHEVDLIIRCHEGVAEIQKNRFATAEQGRIGSTITIY